MTEQQRPLRAAILALVTVLVMTAGGCLAPTDQPLPEDGDTPAPISTVGPHAGCRQYVLELANTAESVARGIDDGTIKASGDAFDAYYKGSDSAKKALNLSLGGYVDKINSPDKPPSAAAWRTLAKEIRKAVR